MLIGDDDYASTGPAGWNCAEIIIAWASCAVVHAAGPSAETYLEAAAGARVTGACALIETDAQHADDWVARFNGKPVLLVLPVGGRHPTSPQAGEIH